MDSDILRKGDAVVYQGSLTEAHGIYRVVHVPPYGYQRGYVLQGVVDPHKTLSNVHQRSISKAEEGWE